MVRLSAPSESFSDQSAPIHLYVFGTFRMEVNGQLCTHFYSDKVRALLVYLVLDGTQPVRREQLAALLWAGYAPKSARANLRRALTELRKLFAPLELLRTTYQTVQLCYGDNDLYCDVVEFRKLISKCRDLPLIAKVGRNTQAISALAHQLYHNEFLPGFEGLDSPPFHVWRTAQATQLAEEYQWLQDGTNSSGI